MTDHEVGASTTERVRPGRQPGEWEIVDDQGDLVAVRFSEEEASAFADGFNLGARQCLRKGASDG